MENIASTRGGEEFVEGGYIYVVGKSLLKAGIFTWWGNVC